MHRPSTSIKRHAVTAALGMLLVTLAGCGTNPVAPHVSDLTTLAKAEKHPNYANGRERNSPFAVDDETGGGASSTAMTDPGAGEKVEEFVIE